MSSIVSTPKLGASNTLSNVSLKKPPLFMQKKKNETQIAEKLISVQSEDAKNSNEEKNGTETAEIKTSVDKTNSNDSEEKIFSEQSLAPTDPKEMSKVEAKSNEEKITAENQKPAAPSVTLPNHQSPLDKLKYVAKLDEKHYLLDLIEEELKLQDEELRAAEKEMQKLLFEARTIEQQKKNLNNDMVKLKQEYDEMEENFIPLSFEQRQELELNIVCQINTKLRMMSELLERSKEFNQKYETLSKYYTELVRKPKSKSKQ